MQIYIKKDVFQEINLAIARAQGMEETILAIKLDEFETENFLDRFREWKDLAVTSVHSPSEYTTMYYYRGIEIRLSKGNK